MHTTIGTLDRDTARDDIIKEWLSNLSAVGGVFMSTGAAI
jgi:hypothetical protein